MNTKLKRIKETLNSILAQFQSERITSDKGILDIQKAGNDIAIGDTVVLVDEDNNETQAENGQYTLTDGTILKIEGGKIEDIVEPEKETEEAPAEEKEEFEEVEVEEAPAEEAPAEEEAPVEEEPAVEEVVEETPVEEPEEAPAEETVEETPAEEEAPAEENFEEVENPTNEGAETDTEAVVKLREEVNELFKLIGELTARLDALEKKPLADPATEEFKKVNTLVQTGDEKLDRLAKIMRA